MFRNTTATPSDTIYASTTTTTYDTTYPDPVNCQWDTCMQQFSCIPFLAQHIEKAHMLKKIMKDNVCLWKNCSRNKKPFKYRYLLVEHLQSHTGEKPNICPVSPPKVTTCLTSDIHSIIVYIQPAIFLV